MGKLEGIENLKTTLARMGVLGTGVGGIIGGAKLIDKQGDNKMNARKLGFIETLIKQSQLPAGNPGHIGNVDTSNLSSKGTAMLNSYLNRPGASMNDLMPRKKPQTAAPIKQAQSDKEDEKKTKKRIGNITRGAQVGSRIGMGIGGGLGALAGGIPGAAIGAGGAYAFAEHKKYGKAAKILLSLLGGTVGTGIGGGIGGGLGLLSGAVPGATIGGAVGAGKAASYNEDNSAYNNGFIDKCIEAGVNPAELLK